MTPQELVAALKGLGLSQRSIGSIIGVNDSYVSQVARGKKSGAAYARTLEQLLSLVQSGERQKERLTGEVERPERRKRKSGEAARVRGAKHYAAGFTASVGEGAARAGARSLGLLLRQAHDAGLQVAWTLTFKPRGPGQAGGVRPESKSGRGRHSVARGKAPRKHRGKPLPPPFTEFRTTDTGALVQELDAAGGDMTAVLIEYASDAGLISWAGTTSPRRELLAIEIRAW